MMSFLYPAFLLGALAVAIPVVLHLLRRDVAPEVPFSAVRLLRHSPIERSRRRRLRDLLLLAARVAALLLLAAAFARPYAAGPAAAGTRVVAIDRSFSMSAPGQFARALDRARGAIEAAGGADRVAVIAFDDRADVIAAPGSRSDARAALDSLTPGFGGTRYAPLVERLAEFAAGGPGTLVVVSDLQRPTWDGEPLDLPPGWRVEVQDVGRPQGNLAVTGITAEPDRVMATVRNTWGQPKQGTLRVSHNDAEIASAPYAVDAAASTPVSIAVRTPPSGALAVSLDDPEGLTADNSRFHVLGRRSQPRVLIVAPESGSRQAGFYLARALETPPGERGFAVGTAAGAAVSKTLLETLAEQDVVVLMSTRGLDRHAREGLVAWTRGGGGLWLAAARDLEASVVSTMFGWQPPLAPEEISAPGLTFAATDLRHPIFRPFGPLLANLGNVRVDRAWRVAAGGWNVLARFSDGNPALLERTESAGRILLFASDLDRRWNDFPLHPSFVPFTLETARYTAGNDLKDDDLIVGEGPAGVPGIPGVHTISPGKGPVAVNVDSRESETDTLVIDEFAGLFRNADGTAGPATRLQAQEVEAAQSYWRYGVILMLAALVLESAIGRAGS